MKPNLAILLLSLLLALTACTGLPARASSPTAVVMEATETQTLPPTENPKPALKTSIGDFIIASSRWVEEVNGVKPGPDEKILLVLLAGPNQARLDPESFSLETFEKALRDLSNGEVHISGDDGSYTISSMAGWVGENAEEFAMGFRLPSTANALQLLWPGNEPIDLHPVQ